MENLNTGLVTQEMTMDNDSNFIVDLTSRTTSFCSLIANTQEEKALLFKAMNNPEKRIGDCINMEIKVKDVYCEVVTCVNKETGEMTDCPRVVLIDEKGVGYQSVSLGIFGALKKLFNVFGMPNEWEKPLTLIVKQTAKGERKLLTFDVK